MAERTSYPPDTVLLLKGPPKGKVMDVEYTVVEDLDKDTLRVRGPETNVFRVHKARVAKVVKEAESQPEDVQTLEVPKSAESKKPKEPESEGRVPRKKEGQKMSTQAATKKAKPKTKAKAKAKAPKNKAPKKAKELVPFNVKEWGKGKTILCKPCKFDHPKFKLIAYVGVDAKAGFYYTVNAYRYPGGVETLGKKNVGGNTYPLKGKKTTTKNKKTKSGKVETRITKGSRTAEEIVAFYQKKGYKIVNKSEKVAVSA